MASGTPQRRQDVGAVLQLAPQERPIKIRMPLLSGGMRTDKAAPDLAPNECVLLSNLNLVAGELSVDTGYVPFGTAYLGQAALFLQVFNPDGTTTELLITTSTVYQYVAGVFQWQLVSFGQLYSINHVGGYPQGTTVFNLTAIGSIVNGSTVGIGQSDGTQLIGTVTVSGTTITMSVPSTTTVNQGAPVALATVLHGDLSAQTQVSFTEFPGNGWTVFCNGVDPIMYYFQSVINNLGGLPTATTCKGMLVSHEQLLLIGTTENGTALPQRLRASDQLNPQQWTPGNGIAAIYDLLDTEDFLEAIAQLGPYVIVYRDTTIMRGTYLGLPNQTWFWEYMVYGEGVISQGSVTELGGQHCFVGNGGIYLYDGGYNLESIGDAVFFDFFSANGIINATARATVFMQYVPDFDEVWVFLPTGTSVYPNMMVRCVLENTSWAVRSYVDQIVSCAPRLPLVSYVWSDTPGLWTSHPEAWDSRVFLQNVANFIFCTVNQPFTMLFDYTASTDNGVVIPWEIQTKEFGNGSDFTRYERWVFDGVGTIDNISYSVDEGSTFTSLGSLTIGDTATTSFYLDITASKVLFQLTGTDPTFQLRWGDLIGVFDSDW